MPTPTHHFDRAGLTKEARAIAGARSAVNQVRKHGLQLQPISRISLNSISQSGKTFSRIAPASRKAQAERQAAVIG
jgi:hypothetical protein